MKNTEYIKAPDKYTTEELFEKIRDCHFTAGTPEYKELGIFKNIKLPAVGRYCIQIMAAGNRIQLAISEDMAKTDQYVANRMTGRKLGVFARALDNDRKPSQELLEKTAAELKGHLGL